MAEKSKEQMKVEKYFEENNVVYEKNLIYGIKRERNLNSFLMMGIMGLILKTGMQPYYILFRENEILFFKVGMMGGIKEFSMKIDVSDIQKITLKKGILNYTLTMSIKDGNKVKKEIINFVKINGKAWWIQDRNELIDGGYFQKLIEKVEGNRMLEQ